MADPRFFKNHGPFTLQALADLSSSSVGEGSDPRLEVTDICGIDDASSSQLTFLKDRKHVARLTKTNASACVLSKEFLEQVPRGLSILLSDDPERAFAKIAEAFYPPGSGGTAGKINEHAVIDPTATLDDGVTVEAGAIIGPDVCVGEGTHVGAHAVIGPGVQIGRYCRLSTHVSIGYALIGDRVTIHAGVRIGEDGFGFAMGASGHQKVPQLGRVIVQDDVEIGANTAIDRGAGPDTVIGEGTKIDNLVQIGHNVRIGRGCVIAGQVGISGSTVLGDFVVLGGQVGVADHIEIGSGAQVAGTAGVMRNIPSGGIYCGTPARPIREFMREIATLSQLAKAKGKRTTKNE